MNLLLCCTLVPAKYEVENKRISNAANRFLTNLCTELEKENSLRILSYIGVDFDEISKKDLESQNNKRIHYFFRSKRLIKGLLQMLYATWKGMSQCDYAMTYNVVYAWMLTPTLAKLKRKKSVLILADYSPVESYVSKKQQLYAKVQQYFIGKYDYVVGLSENTQKYLKFPQKFICMEGGISGSFYDFFDNYKDTKDDKIILMYSGILEKVTGVDLLVEAFKKLEVPNVELVITGDGSLATWIIGVAEKYSNIKYLGCLPYDQYMEKLLAADMLVNPRNMNLPENENNFPSKIMEYLATGKVIVSTKFPGWEKYEEYIIFSESSIENLKEKIEKTIENEKEFYRDRFLCNREFSKKFLWGKQVERIELFLKE